MKIDVAAILENCWVWFSDVALSAWAWLANWENIKAIASSVGDICLFFIAVYTFRLTIFPKKLKFVGFRENRSTFDGDSYEITLENRSLCPVIVHSVELIIDSQRISVFDGECIVEGFKTAKVVLEPYTEIISEQGAIDIDVLRVGEMSLWVKTSRGAQHVKYESLSWWARRAEERKHKKWLELKGTTVSRQHHNEKLVVPNMAYALSYVDENGELQTVFIHKSGAMSHRLFGYNRLSNELMENEELLVEHFRKELTDRGLSGKIERFNQDKSPINAT